MRCWIAVPLLVVLATPATAGGDHFRPLTRHEPIVRMVLQEAANEPFIGMLAIAGVAIDRVRDRRWPSTSKKVVYQFAQFTGMGIKLRRYTRGQIIRARRAVTGASYGLRPCGKVLWYHTDKVKPSWRTEYRRVCQLGAHIFYGDRR